MAQNTAANKTGLPATIAGIFASHRQTVILALIVALGLALRLCGTGFALPTISYDEGHILDTVWTMQATGDWNPHTFGWGSLHFYLDLFILKFLNVFGSPERADFYFACRIFEAIIGALTIIVVYRIAAGVYGRNTGLLAALLAAIFPAHIFYSHIAKVDVLVAFLALLSLDASLRILKTGAYRYYTYAAIAAGLATATKYNGAFAVLAPVAAHLLYCDVRKMGIVAPRHVAALVGLPLLAFFVTTPFALLDWSTFWHDVFYQAGRSGIDIGAYFSGYYTKISGNLGWLMLLAWLASAVFSGIKRRQETTLLLLFILAGGISLLLWKAELRFFLPVGIAMLIMVAGILNTTLEYLKTTPYRGRRQMGRIGLALGLILLMVIPVGEIISQCRTLAKTSVSEVASDYIIRNVPPGSSIYRGNNTPYIHYLKDGGDYRYDSPRGVDIGREPTWDYDSYDEFAAGNYDYVILTNEHRTYIDYPGKNARQNDFYAAFYAAYELIENFDCGDDYAASTIEASPYKNRLYLFALAGTHVPTPAEPEATALTASADTFISEAYPDGNNGSKITLEVSDELLAAKRALLRFEPDAEQLAAIAAAENITLAIYAGSVTGSLTITVRPFLPDGGWDETGATWNGNGDAAWDTPGGPVGEPVLATVRIDETDEEQWLGISLPPAQIRAIINHSNGGFSLMLKAASETVTFTETAKVKFKPRETDTDLKPHILYR